MSLITTAEANEILLEIVDMQSALIHRLMSALGAFEAYEDELKRIEEKKKKLEGH